MQFLQTGDGVVDAGEFALVLLQVGEHEHICVYDLEAPVEHDHHTADAQILRAVEVRIVDVATGFGDAGSGQELAGHAPRVPGRLLVDHEGVGSQTEVDYELTICILILVVFVLSEKRTRVQWNTEKRPFLEM